MKIENDIDVIAFMVRSNSGCIGFALQLVVQRNTFPLAPAPSNTT
jgi:hypothetical protein